MSSVGNPRRNARKRIPPATRRRALELLAASRDGCTEALMFAHGFTIEQMVELVCAGLATEKAARVVPAGRTIEVARVRIRETIWQRGSSSDYSVMTQTKARAGLIGLSNSYATYGNSKASARRTIETALRIKG
jgi:hypothetical protein